MSEHTPGPWHVRQFQDGHAFIIAVAPNEDEQFVANAATTRGEANARLIAAAPDLLAALKDTTFALDWHCREGAGPNGMDHTFIKLARAAITKAEQK